MKKFNISNTRHPVVLLILGLFLAQILAAIQVYLSNIDLHATLSAVKAARYLAVPNEKVMPVLLEFRTAFWGGLFFTFSIGAGISLGSMAAAWIWHSVLRRHKIALFFFLAIWGGLLLSINVNGFALIPNLYFLLIPPALFLLTLKQVSQSDINSNRIQLLVHVLPIPLLALMWFTQFDSRLFLDLRDNLLLSNLLGKKFNNLYYRYTLYPAEVFKSLDQKTIKTCTLKNISNPSLQSKLEKTLIAYDYLPLSDAAKVDLTLVQDGNNIGFKAHGQRILQVKTNQFLFDSKRVLQRFAWEIDHFGTFRQITFLSLLIGFPILIYILIHASLYYALFFFLNPKTAALTASVLCLLIGSIALLYFQTHRSSNIAVENIAESLKSDNWQTRIAALKVIHQKGLEISAYQTYPQLLKSRIPQERYWLARSLAVSRQRETYDDLLNLMHDNNTNVRTMVYYSLGQRKNPRAIRPILESIENSDDWYTQMYAYKALRSLGWKQKKLP